MPAAQGIPEGHEMELCTMVIECCSNEKTFVKWVACLWPPLVCKICLDPICMSLG